MKQPTDANMLEGPTTVPAIDVILRIVVVFTLLTSTALTVVAVALSSDSACPTIKCTRTFPYDSCEPCPPKKPPAKRPTRDATK